MKGDFLHGGVLDRMRAEFPAAPEPWLDLSTGINPVPYKIDPMVLNSLGQLPTSQASISCINAMAQAIGAPPTTLLLAPGSELLIRMLPRVISPRRVVVLSPSYGDHAEVWRHAGHQVIAEADPLGAVDAADAVVICNPNNPDGQVFKPEILERAREQLASRGGWLIIDEAYADLSPNISMADNGGKDGLIILRSFGKFYGLAGLRLGAIIAPLAVRKALSQQLGVWPVGTLALTVGANAYADYEWQEITRRRLSQSVESLDAVLFAAGLDVVGGTDLFRYVACEHAHAIWAQLAQDAIYVRRFNHSERHLRIGIPADHCAQTRLRSSLISL